MTVCVHEHEPVCEWAYGTLRLADVWKKGKKRDRDAGEEEEEEKSGGGEELYSEELVERKEALWNGRSLGLAEG